MQEMHNLFHHSSELLRRLPVWTFPTSGHHYSERHIVLMEVQIWLPVLLGTILGSLPVYTCPTTGHHYMERHIMLMEVQIWLLVLLGTME